MHLAFTERFALWLYGCVMAALAPLLRLKLHRRGRRESLYLERIEHRFGYYPEVSGVEGLIWVHAVSLGETRAAGILIKALREQNPAMRLLLTHGTATGWAEGGRLLKPGDIQVWAPWDTPAVVHRFLNRFRPCMGILLETEVWPFWVRGCREQGIPLYLVNARMSQRSLIRALRFRGLALPAYRGLHAVLAQTESDAERLRQLEAPVKLVMGNLKYDLVEDPAQKALGQQWRASLTRPAVMLASSREGEEAEFLKILNDLGAAADTVQWMIVPRHPQRFDAVARLITDTGWTVQRRSQWSNNSPPDFNASMRTIWLGDSLGEMQAYYHLASVAWLGGSFAPFGGQNLIEASACGCPVIMGPHTFNFTEAAELALQSGAAKRVVSMKLAWHETNRWLGSSDHLKAAGDAHRLWLEQSRGSATRSTRFLLGNSIS